MSDAYRTIGEVSKLLGIKPHVLRFWEHNFKQIAPLKRRGGRRLYSESDITLLRFLEEQLRQEVTIDFISSSDIFWSTNRYGMV